MRFVAQEFWLRKRIGHKAALTENSLFANSMYEKSRVSLNTLAAVLIIV